MATADPALLEARVRAAEAALAAHYGRTLVERTVRVASGSDVRVVDYPATTPSDAAAALPPILMLHGIASTTAPMLPLSAVLADRRVLAVDWPGHGLSGRDVVAPGELRTHVTEVIEAVLGAFKVDRVDIVGHALGGQAALYFALAHPDQLRRLVLLGAPDAAFSQTRPSVGMRLLSIPGIGIAMLGLSTSQRAHDRAVHRLFGAGALVDSPPEINEIGYLASQRPEFAPSVSRLVRALVTPLGTRADVPLSAEELAHLAVPTLIVWGVDDAILAPAQGRSSAGAMPHITIVEVEGGHAPWLDDPARVGNAVSEFLSRTAATAEGATGQGATG